MQKLIVYSGALACALGATSLSAQETQRPETFELEQVTVEASLSNVAKEYQSKSISIINPVNLNKHSTSGDVQSVLSWTPSIEYSRSGGINGQLSFRGQNSNNGRSLNLVDGVRLSGRSTLEFNLIDPNSLESVEVIRGSGSSLYGSGGMNGVINLQSRRYRGDITKPFSLGLKVRNVGYAGVNDGFSSRVEAIGGGNGFDVLLGLSNRTGGDYDTPEGRVRNSRYRHIGADLNLGYTHNDTRYYLQARYNRATTHRGGGLGGAPGSHGNKKLMKESPISEYYVKLGLETSTSFADMLDAFLYYREYDTDIHIETPKARVHQKVYNTQIVGGAARFISNIGNHELGYGIDFQSSIWHTPKVKKTTPKATNISKIEVLDRPWDTTNIGVYIKDDYFATDRLMLSGSLRYDYFYNKIGKRRATGERPETSLALDNASSSDKHVFTGSLGGVYFLNDNFSVAANISHNFKAAQPSQMMQATPAGTGDNPTIPNPGLSNETSQTYELGLRYSDANSFVGLTGFYTKYKDMISLVNVAGGKRQYQNTGKAYITGLELEGTHIYDKWNLYYSAAYIYGQNQTKNKPLSYIAPFNAKVALGYDTEYAEFGIKQRLYIGKNRIDEAAERKTASYGMTDLYADIKLNRFIPGAKDMYLTVGVDNVFDKRGVNPTTYEDIKHNITKTNPLLEPGRNVYVKFRHDY